MPNWMKYVGALDGAFLAGATYLGHAVPQWDVYTTPLVIALGTLGSILGGLHMAGAPVKENGQ
jgi:hypothetical protein